MTVTAVPKRTLVAKIEERVKSGKCLVCEDEGKMKRGLCGRHYMAFRRMQAAKPRDERVDFEANAIREGKILAVNEVRRITTDNPFADC